MLKGKWKASAVLAVIGSALLLGFSSAPAGAAEACPNESVRLEQGAADLAECRAYEMVTPSAKASGEPVVALEEVSGGRETAPLQTTRLFPVNGARAAIDGGRVAWLSEPLPGASSVGLNYLSSRGATGWASVGAVPPMSPVNGLLCPPLMGVSAWSSDLARSVLDLPAGPPASNAIAPGFKGEDECGHDEPRLIPGEPERFRNLFVHDFPAGTYQLVNVTPGDVIWPEPQEGSQRYWPASFLAASDGLDHVVFEEELALTDDAPIGYRGGNELYEWTDEEVRLVTYLPDETPVHGSLAGATRNYGPTGTIADQVTNVAQFRHAVSVDGSRIFFEAEGGLYLREGGARTVQVDASQGAEPSGGGRFLLASADGSRVFFSAESQLTVDSTAAPGEPDLYEYRVEPGGPGVLVDLTVNAGEPANVLGVSGASEDGSHVYVVAQGALTATPNSHGDSAVAGAPNLYLLREGSVTFVATLNRFADDCDWATNAHCGGAEEAGPSLTARVSRGGDFIGFNSVRSLTGYDNTDVNSGEPDIEIFLYAAASNELSCASCNPSGSHPVAGAAIHWPANPGNNANWSNAYPQRNVSDHGQVFFETADALLPRDVNGVRDVYEFFDGELRLISTGRGGAGFHFLDATPDGSNVFFSTAQALLPRDIDSVPDYYDARSGGGFPEPPPPPPPCSPGSCRDSSSAAGAIPAPGTATFTGPGNQRPRRCVARHRLRRGKKGHHRRASAQAERRQAKAKRCKRGNRRASK